MSDLLDRLKAHIESITPEEFDKEIEEIEKLHGNGVGTYDPYMYDERDFIGEAERSRAIDFAKWLAKEWMSIWVVDKWLWEWQPERTPETIHMHLKYYTEEELYELYLESLNK